MKKSIVLCADDFGQAEVISGGILNLIQLGRISATSCLVNMPDWALHASYLRPVIGKVDIGLHFNLTLGRPLSNIFRANYGHVFPSLSWWMAYALIGKLNKNVIASELQAQLDTFMEHLGLPTHIDGHQHLHQFPLIQDVVLTEYQNRFKASLPKPYVRLSLLRTMGKGAMTRIKMMTINRMGGTSLQKKLLQLGVPHNRDFSGVYSFDTDNYRQLFKEYLSSTYDGGMIICHPAMSKQISHDAIANARWQEYQYFTSESFIADCESSQVMVRRFQW